MLIPSLIIVIEKIGDTYHSYSPNLVGVTAVGNTREEVERNMLALIQSHAAELRHRYGQAAISLQPSEAQLGESTMCVAKTAQGTEFEEPCTKTADREGLCWQHWKKLYGHVYNPRHAFWVCELCGEQNQYKLDKWDDPCSFKAQHPEWPTVLAEKKEAALKQKREARANARSTQRKPLAQCQAVSTKGVQCERTAVRSNLCTTHWVQLYGHQMGRSKEGMWRVCKLCGYKEDTDYILSGRLLFCPDKELKI